MTMVNIFNHHTVVGWFSKLNHRNMSFDYLEYKDKFLRALYSKHTLRCKRYFNKVFMLNITAQFLAMEPIDFMFHFLLTFFTVNPMNSDTQVQMV